MTAVVDTEALVGGLAVTAITTVWMATPGPNATNDQVAAWYLAKGHLHERLALAGGPDSAAESAYAATAYDHARRLEWRCPVISDERLLAEFGTLLEMDGSVPGGVVAAIHEAVNDDEALANALIWGFTDAEIDAIRDAAARIRGAR